MLIELSKVLALLGFPLSRKGSANTPGELDLLVRTRQKGLFEVNMFNKNFHGGCNLLEAVGSTVQRFRSFKLETTEVIGTMSPCSRGAEANICYPCRTV